MRLDKAEALRRARAAIEGGRSQEALPHLWSLLDRTHLAREELNGYLRILGQALAALERHRAAATVALFLQDTTTAQRLSQGVPTDLARCAIQNGNPTEAARYFEQAEWLGHAAIQLERADDDRSARVLWERLVSDGRLASEPYTRGLVAFNLGRTCDRLGDRPAARRAYVQSIHLLEAAADGFEIQGLRERAFDCFQVIMALGKEGAFENLAEGYLNCVRILKEDGLKYYVLQYYEDFQKLALERGELHAAATLFREAAEFCRRHDLPYEAHYQDRAADTHVRAAQKTIDEAGPLQLAENSYAAAIDLYNEVGSYSQVRQIYRWLADLPLGEKRQQRYARLSERLADEVDDRVPLTSFPDYLRTDTAYPDIWRIDVIDWEQQGDPAETMAEVIQDPKWPDFTHRRALLCRLFQLSAPESPLSAETLIGLAEQLGQVEIYVALSPLERLFEHADARVRAACMRAVRQLFFKRSFVLISRGLADPAEEVRSEALAAVSTLHFGHAFDPLSRIYRESSNREVREAALTSIGKISSTQAAEFLIDVLRQGDQAEQSVAQKLLARFDHPEVTELLRRASGAESPGPIRHLLDGALAGRR